MALPDSGDCSTLACTSTLSKPEYRLLCILLNSFLVPVRQNSMDSVTVRDVSKAKKIQDKGLTPCHSLTLNANGHKGKLES